MIDSPAAVLVDALGQPLSGGDAFGRLRVSDPFTLFDSKQIYDNQPLLFAEDLVSGATITHLPNEAASQLAVSANGSIATRQTRRYFNYQPGKSHLIYATFAGYGIETNAFKRVGYFDNNDGIFFQSDPTNGFSFVRRTSTSGSASDADRVIQANWSFDTLDGSSNANNPSGINLDPDNVNILVIDFEWLGAGRVRIGFVIGGVVRWCHEFTHANQVPTVYMKTPNLPVRWQIVSVGGGAATCKSICCSVQSEGGQEDTGIRRSVNRGITPQSVTNVLEPLISVRLQSGRRAAVFIETLSVMSSSNANLFWVLSINPTITGGTAASWTAVPNSSVEYDIARDGTISPGNEGTVVVSGYLSNNNDEVQATLNGLLALAADVSGTGDQWVLSAQNTAGAAEDIFASINYIEL